MGLSEVILVEWIDSASPGGVWLTIDEAEAWAEMDTPTCYSVGFLHSETDNAVILHGDTNEDCRGRLMLIPKFAITRREVLWAPPDAPESR